MLDTAPPSSVEKTSAEPAGFSFVTNTSDIPTRVVCTAPGVTSKGGAMKPNSVPVT